MIGGNIIEGYMDWLFNMAFPTTRLRDKYSILLNHLYSLEFVYINELDENRYVDGVSLRNTFKKSLGIDEDIPYDIDHRACSVLEMMLALASRIESSLMYDHDLGDRTNVWFWEMVNNLDIYMMSNDNFSKEWVDHKIDIFLNRQYQSNGIGGLFYVYNPRQDMRTVEIWYQMAWYMDNYIKKNL